MTASVYTHRIPRQDDLANFDDFLYHDLKVTVSSTPTAEPDTDPPYRCPVSTPANFIPKVRRNKPVAVSLEFSLPPSAQRKRSVGGKLPRPVAHKNHNLLSIAGKVGSKSNGGGNSKQTRELASGATSAAGAVHSSSLQYYYKEKSDGRPEVTQSNTFWLQSLCSQPVQEILDKYRRRSDLRASRTSWTKVYTTPGERSLLRAWEKNVPRALASSALELLASSEVCSQGRLKDNHGADNRSLAGSSRQHQTDLFAVHRSRTASDLGERNDLERNKGVHNSRFKVSTDDGALTLTERMHDRPPHHCDSSIYFRRHDPTGPLPAFNRQPGQFTLPEVQQNRNNRQRNITSKRQATPADNSDQRHSIHSDSRDTLRGPSGRSKNFSKVAVVNWSPTTPNPGLPAIGFSGSI